MWFLYSTFLSLASYLMVFCSKQSICGVTVTNSWQWTKSCICFLGGFLCILFMAIQRSFLHSIVTIYHNLTFSFTLKVIFI